MRSWAEAAIVVPVTTSDLDVAPRSRLAVMARRGLLRGLIAAVPVAIAAGLVSSKLTKPVLGFAVAVAVVTAIAAAIELGADQDEPRLHERTLATWLLAALLFTAAAVQAAVLRRPRILSYEAHRLLGVVFASGMAGAVLATPWALVTGWRVARRAGAHAAAAGTTSSAPREWRATLLLYTVGTGGALLATLPVVGLLALIASGADWLDRRLVPRDAGRFDPAPAPIDAATVAHIAPPTAPPPSGTASTAPDVAGA